MLLHLFVFLISFYKEGMGIMKQVRDHESKHPNTKQRNMGSLQFFIFPSDGVTSVRENKNLHLSFFQLSLYKYIL